MTWAAYSIALGIGAGHVLSEHHPLVGVAVGVVGGLVTGVVVDRALRRLHRRVPRRPAPPEPDVDVTPVSGRPPTGPVRIAR